MYIYDDAATVHVHLHVAHISLCLGLLKKASSLAVSDVEGMVSWLIIGVTATLCYEGVGSAPERGDLGDEQAIQVVRDAPASVNWVEGEHKSILKQLRYMYMYSACLISLR